ncbi:MAG: NUDIX domain-containing protein [Maricaulaceae bacterium]|jgi:ADP-ribose pyrophosphatase YjhB (NUDIX family)
MTSRPTLRKATVEKALIYCIQDHELLVFSHPDFPAEEVGIQVPGGTVRPGEPAETAAGRELAEETGREDFEIVRLIGSADYDVSPYGPEIHHRRFFQARPKVRWPERWISWERHDGRGEPTRFEFFWLPLARAHVLQAGQGALISELAALLDL